MLSSKELSKLTKQRLLPIFGKGNVAVRKGSGTASGWVSANVEIPKPEFCECDNHSIPHSRSGWCPQCREALDAARKLIDDATKDIKYYTFCSDDGYGTDRNCFNSSVHFKA